MTNHKFKNNPYNTNNKLISLDDISNILKEYNITNKPTNIDIYQRAFIHKSYTKLKDYEEYSKPSNCLELFENSYETLEFLGDSIIGNIISLYLYQRYFIIHKQDEGFLTKLKIRLVNGEQLAEFSKILKLQNFLIISNHIEENCEGKENTNLLEDIFESFIGALYLDTNSYEIVTNFLINIIETHIDFSDLIMNDNNYKDQILRYFQHNFSIHPKYETFKHENIFISNIYLINDIEKTLIVSGKGSTKKKAEQEAAKKCLIHYQILNK
tara:strand:- start:705 stop:1511 length:807 start_codon:yes stop_codon:yes gene_type:complete